MLAVVSARGYHHPIGLNTCESLGAPPPPAGTTGLYRLAIGYPTRAALADAPRLRLAAGIRARARSWAARRGAVVGEPARAWPTHAQADKSGNVP